MSSIKQSFRDAINDAMGKESVEIYNRNKDPNEVSKLSFDNVILKNGVVGEEEDGETTEATGASASGSFSSPMFMRNNLFQPNTKTELKKIPVVREEELEGGIADDKTIKDIAKKHGVSVKKIKNQLVKGIKIEKEHTDKKSEAEEIALDHLMEFPDYYDRLEKMESKAHKEETKEATTSASVGAYDAPFGSPKKDPLSIETPESVYGKLRAVKDPKFPKYGGKGAKHVRVKNICKTFPYCDQGINAIEFFENESLKEAIKNISTKYKISDIDIKYIILENLNIYNKKQKQMNEIEKLIDGIVDKVLNEEIQNKVNIITEDVSKNDISLEEFFEMELKKLEETYGLEENEVEEGNAYSGARCKAGCKGGNGTEIEGFDGKTVEDWSDEDRKSCGCDDTVKESLQLTEKEMIDLIEKIIREEKIEGTKAQNDAMKASKEQNEENIKEVGKKMKKYTKEGSTGEYKESPEDFPKGNGDMKEMKKKAFQRSKEANEFIETYAHPGMTEIDYDIAPTDEDVEAYLTGDSKKGNAEIGEDGKPLGNVVPSEVGKKMLKKYKSGEYAEHRRTKSFEKDVQPVIDKEDTEGKVIPGAKKIKKESVEDKKVINEISRIRNLFEFNYKSQ